MSEVTMIGCDLHDDSMVLMVATGPGKPIRKKFSTKRAWEMIDWVRQFADDKDALMILDEVRSYVLAGRPLPAVWVPDLQTRRSRTGADATASGRAANVTPRCFAN